MMDKFVLIIIKRSRKWSGKNYYIRYCPILDVRFGISKKDALITFHK